MHLFALSRAARVLAWVRRPRSVSPVFRSTAILSASLVLLLAGGCGSGEAPSFRTEETEAPEPPKEVTGRKAFQNMFVAARSWARDAKPFHLTNFYLKQSTGVGGLATAWTASFASPSLRKYKTYTYLNKFVIVSPGLCVVIRCLGIIRDLRFELPLGPEAYASDLLCQAQTPA